MPVCGCGISTPEGVYTAPAVTTVITPWYKLNNALVHTLQYLCKKDITGEGEETARESARESARERV